MISCPGTCTFSNLIRYANGVLKTLVCSWKGGGCEGVREGGRGVQGVRCSHDIEATSALRPPHTHTHTHTHTRRGLTRDHALGQLQQQSIKLREPCQQHWVY